jgi:hypothetical protein
VVLLKNKTDNIKFQKSCADVTEQKIKKINMIKLSIILLTLILNVSSLKAAEPKCETVRDKIDPRCSKILKGVGSKAGGFLKSLKEFSDKNKTITQSLDIDKKERKKTPELTLESLKKFSKEHKTIIDTIEKQKK